MMGLDKKYVFAHFIWVTCWRTALRVDLWVLSGSDPFVDLGSWRMGCADQQQLRISAESDKEIDDFEVDS